MAVDHSAQKFYFACLPFPILSIYIFLKDHDFEYLKTLLISNFSTGFDENPGQTKVLIGNDECEIQDIDSNSLTCLTPSETDSGINLWPGNAGLKYELWIDSEIEMTLNMTADILPGLFSFCTQTFLRDLKV